MNWSCVYEQAIREDGSLLFPERLSAEFLDQARRTMGSYLFANQYQNTIIPEEDQCFKKDWLRYYTSIPEIKYTFCAIDPAISQQVESDYTGIVVVDVDVDRNWYLRLARRMRATPTQIVEMIFRINEEFKPQVIGIEDISYQKALLYMVEEERLRRGTVIPIKGIHPDTVKSKEMRILGLVPRFEFQRIAVAQGLTDFEDEYNMFPRGDHDDILDALAYCDRIVYYPIERKKKDVPKPTDADYERFIIKNIHKGKDLADEYRSANDPTYDGYDD